MSVDVVDAPNGGDGGGSRFAATETSGGSTVGGVRS